MAPKLTPSRAKNIVAVAKILVPAVLPVVTPYLIKAAALTRDGFDQYRARRLGIGVDDLPKFSGRGGALHVRIVGADHGLAELSARGTTDESDTAFVAASRATLGTLAVAVRAAERMPTTRRRAAHRSVSGELDRIERDLLQRLGV
jgi:hypothetical protein